MSNIKNVPMVIVLAWCTDVHSHMTTKLERRSIMVDHGQKKWLTMVNYGSRTIKYKNKIVCYISPPICF